MEKLWHKLVKEEKGQSLLAVMIVLAVGAVTITASLGYAFASLNLGHVTEKQVERFYAANAGIEYAVWRVEKEDPDLDGNLDSIIVNWTTEDKKVNDCTVEIKFDFDFGSSEYTITATATDPDDSTVQTKIEEKVVPG